MNRLGSLSAYVARFVPSGKEIAGCVGNKDKDIPDVLNSCTRKRIRRRMMNRGGLEELDCRVNEVRVGTKIGQLVFPLPCPLCLGQCIPLVACAKRTPVALVFRFHLVQLKRRGQMRATARRTSETDACDVGSGKRGNHNQQNLGHGQKTHDGHDHLSERSGQVSETRVSPSETNIVSLAQRHAFPIGRTKRARPDVPAETRDKAARTTL